MRNSSQRLAAIACGLVAVLAGSGCQRQQTQVSAMTPQQRQAEIDSNSHIPAAQKAAIKARLASQPVLRPQPTPPGAH